MHINTPYYLIDEKKLLKNLKKIEYVSHISGTRFILALKCFSTWNVFPLMKKYMAGTTSSSLYEARLGYEKFGKETHAYCVGFSKNDVIETAKFSDKIIFNSVSQLKLFYPYVKNLQIGIRINPKISYSHFDLADPARKHSRLGVIEKVELLRALPLINGAMFHFNCENCDFKNFAKNLDYLSKNYEAILDKLEWLSLGGGIYFTKDGYPLKSLAKKLKEFSKLHNLQIYMEPGEAAITESTELVTKVVDIVHNEIDIAIVDASAEAHMLDLLIYHLNAKIKNSDQGKFKYMIAGRSCLAGDVFGTYKFYSKLRIGSIIKFSDAAGYTMVKKNWFNGLQMPAIAVKKLDGSIKLIRRFEYKDFKNSLS
jgi:carboxynorspermidine decarboxylase